MTAKNLLVNATLILASVALSLTIGEFAVRALKVGTVRLNSMQGTVIRYKPHLRFLNRKENSNWVETNAFGFHDYERDKARGKYRILFIGDSFVEGQQVSTDKLFTSVLETRFLQAAGQAECINAGVSGTGTAFQYTLWKDFFEGKVPINHLVLVFYMGNDIENNNIDLSYPPNDNSLFVDSAGNVFRHIVKESTIKKLVGRVRDHSALTNTAYEMLYLARRNRLKGDRTKTEGIQAVNNQVNEKDVAAWQDATKGTLALIGRWKTELANKNIPMDVMVIDRPGKSYNDQEMKFLLALGTMTAELRIGFLRLQLTDNPYETYSFDGKTLGHLNVKGHELAASEFYDYFLASYPNAALAENRAMAPRNAK